MKRYLLALVACLLVVAAPTVSAQLIADEMEVRSVNGLIAGVVPFDGYPDVAHISIFGSAESGLWRPAGAIGPQRLNGEQTWELRTGLTMCGWGEGYWGAMGLLMDEKNYATAGLRMDSAFAEDPDKLHLVITVVRNGVEQVTDMGRIKDEPYACDAFFPPMFRLYILYDPVARSGEFGVMEGEVRSKVDSGSADWMVNPRPFWLGAGKKQGDYVSVGHAVPDVWRVETR